MKVLILSCNTGEGHNSCARAIKEVFDHHGEECVVDDGLRFISKGMSRLISGGHVFIYRHIPRFFSWGYGFMERHLCAFKTDSFFYKLFSLGADNLSRFISDERYDTVICTHPFTSLMMTEVQRRCDLPVTTALVATDFTCSPSVKDSKLDCYYIPHENLAADFECENIPKEKMTVSGIPIRQMFYHTTEKTTAKRMSGVPEDKPHILMMCGSMGCGPIEKLTGLLTDNEGRYTLTVVCGTNLKLKKQLERRYGSRSNLRICGYVKDMSAMLDSADLYLTKPGGISVSEAAVKCLPMVFINAVAGCEAYNADFFTQLGAARISDDVQELADICRSIISEPTELESMKAAFSDCRDINAAEVIYSSVCSKHTSKKRGRS